MPKFMTDHLSPAQIESEINQVHAEIRRKASSLNARRGELTSQGFTAEWERATAVERNRLQELAGVADGWATSARTAAQKIKGSVLPQPTDEQRDGAERTAARILGRNLDSAAAAKLVRELDASPAKTIVVEELQARGVISADMVHGVLCDVSEEYRGATRAEQAADATAGILNRRLNGVASKLELGSVQTSGEGGEVTSTPTLRDMDLSPVADVRVAAVPGADVRHNVGKLIAAD
ncbi:MAG: hypothetical protein ACLT2I_04120 [Corynebacterium variabile]